MHIVAHPLIKMHIVAQSPDVHIFINIWRSTKKLTLELTIK